MAKDYYNLLGVARTATPDEIKRAYRRLAHKYHPDKAGGNEEQFKEVNEAYQVLSDQEKRSQYDQFGQTFDSAGSNGNPFGGFNVNAEDLGGFSDIFEQFFGGARGGRSARGVRRGQDVGVDVTLSFQESAIAASRDFSLNLYHTCEHCHGNGAEPGTPIKDCPTCQGSGTVRTAQRSMFGMVAQATLCPDCQGEGKRAEKVCTVCRGEGRTKRSRDLSVDIPAGIADGQTIRISGKGEAPPRGGLAGDLYVTVHVEPHATLRREGDHVHTQTTVSFAAAALGTTVKVDTLTGKSTVTVPAGTQPATRLTLAQQGFPNVQTGRKGDEVVTVNVEIPKKLSRRQRQLLEEFAAAGKKGFFH